MKPCAGTLLIGISFLTSCNIDGELTIDERKKPSLKIRFFSAAGTELQDCDLVHAGIASGDQLMLFGREVEFDLPLENAERLQAARVNTADISPMPESWAKASWPKVGDSSQTRALKMSPVTEEPKEGDNASDQKQTKEAVLDENNLSKDALNLVRFYRCPVKDPPSPKQ